MKTIVFLDHAQAIGGAESMLLSLFRHLDEYEIHLLCQEGELERKARSIKKQVVIHPFSLPRLRSSPHFFTSLVQVARQIATLAEDVDAIAIYSNTNRTAFYGKLASVIGKRPFIWHVHDFWLSESQPKFTFIDQILKQILSWNTHTIAVSQAVADKLPQNKGLHVVYNGIELANFDANINPTPFRQQYKIPTDARVIGMVGRLRPWKGQTTFLKMAAKIATTHPNVYFLIVGGTTFAVNDSYPQQLANLAQELNITDKVIFTGETKNVPEAFAAMDVFVHPGDPEPFGLVNIEAMTMQKPVVAFAHGALPEIVVDGQTGLLVAPYDIGALVTAVLNLLNNPQNCAKMGQLGEERAKAQFTIQHTAEQIASIYQKLV